MSIRRTVSFTAALCCRGCRRRGGNEQDERMAIDYGRKEEVVTRDDRRGAAQHCLRAHSVLELTDLPG